MKGTINAMNKYHQLCSACYTFMSHLNKSWGCKLPSDSATDSALVKTKVTYPFFVLFTPPTIFRFTNENLSWCHVLAHYMKWATCGLGLPSTDLHYQTKTSKQFAFATSFFINLHMSVQDVLRLLFSIPKSEFYKYEENGKKLSLCNSIRQPAGRLGVRHF
jgi:hypothetical protein